MQVQEQPDVWQVTLWQKQEIRKRTFSSKQYYKDFDFKWSLFIKNDNFPTGSAIMQEQEFGLRKKKKKEEKHSKDCVNDWSLWVEKWQYYRRNRKLHEGMCLKGKLKIMTLMSLQEEKQSCQEHGRRQTKSGSILFAVHLQLNHCFVFNLKYNKTKQNIIFRLACQCVVFYFMSSSNWQRKANAKSLSWSLVFEMGSLACLFHI